MLQFKIICLVRKNDWQAAALAFTVGSSLRQFDEKEKQLLLIKEININIGCELDNQNQILRNLESTTDNSNLVIKDLNTRIKKLT